MSKVKQEACKYALLDCWFGERQHIWVSRTGAVYCNSPQNRFTLYRLFP